MKQFLSILSLAAILAACTGTGGAKGGRAINVAITGAGGKTIYFDKFVNGKPVHVDSTVLDGDGEGTLHVPRLPLDYYRLVISEGQQTILALDSTDEVIVEAKADSMFLPTRISGSPKSEALIAFYRAAGGMEREMNDFMQQNSHGSDDPSAMMHMNQLRDAYTNFLHKAIADNPGTPVSLAAGTRLNKEQELDLCAKVAADLKSTMGQSGFYKSFRDEVDYARQQIQAQQAQQQQQAQMGSLIPIGAPAPDFRQEKPDGGDLGLSDLRGKVVLVDFWASWCRPCRMENPNLVAAYKKYHGKGFEVLSVSLDREKNSWVAAIKQDGLVWNTHVSDLQWWNNAAAKQYGISSIPYSVLVDREGNVVDKNLRGDALNLKLAQLFGS